MGHVTRILYGTWAMMGKSFFLELSVAALSGWLCSMVYLALISAAVTLDGYGLDISTRSYIAEAKQCAERLGNLLLLVECLSIVVIMLVRSGKVIRSISAMACFVLVQVASIGLALSGQSNLFDSTRRWINGCVCQV